MKNREQAKPRVLKKQKNNTFFSSELKNNNLPALSRQILKQKDFPEKFIDTEKITISADYKPQKGVFAKLKNLKKKLLYKWQKSVSGFRAHLTVYLSAVIFFIFLNIFTGSGHPWAYYPITGWGIGVLCHLQEVWNAKREKDEILPLKGISDEELLVIRKIQKETSGFRTHLMSYIAVIGFLLGINLITSGLSSAWFLYPAGGWFIGLMAHFNSYKSKKKFFLESLGQDYHEDAVDHISENKQTQKLYPQNKTLEKAISLKGKLHQQWQENENLRVQWGEDAPELLSQYVSQIAELTERENELTELLSEMSIKEQKDKITELDKKLSQASNPLLQKEYKKAIEQNKHQVKILENLAEQKEIISLRIDSALSLLKQMQLNAARMQGIDRMAEGYSMKELKSKTQELSEYIDDLEASYNELDL